MPRAERPYWESRRKIDGKTWVAVQEFDDYATAKLFRDKVSEEGFNVRLIQKMFRYRLYCTEEQLADVDQLILNRIVRVASWPREWKNDDESISKPDYNLVRK